MEKKEKGEKQVCTGDGTQMGVCFFSSHSGMHSVAKTPTQVCNHFRWGEKQVCTHGHPPLVCGCNELIRKGRSWACKAKLTFLDNSTP